MRLERFRYCLPEGEKKKWNKTKEFAWSYLNLASDELTWTVAIVLWKFQALPDGLIAAAR